MSLAEYQSDYFDHEEHGSVVVVSIDRPKLSEEQNLEEFAEQLFAYVEHYECRRLVLNCEKVGYASSGALGKLITLHRRLNREDGRLVLCGFTAGLRDILVAARLFDYFETAETAAAAVTLLQDESEQA